MVKLKVVTGFVPIPGYPRSPQEWGKLLEDFGKAIDMVPKTLYLESLEKMWLLREAALWQARTKQVLKVAAADNPQKNTLAYHAVQHQKFVWLAREAQKAEEDVLVWIDAGILHVPGVTATVIQEFLNRVKTDDFAIPGCWHKDDPRCATSALNPNWRFCGGVIVVPKPVAFWLLQAVKTAVKAHWDLTSTVNWEVNTLASAERAGSISPRWYEADHNELMFTRY